MIGVGVNPLDSRLYNFDTFIGNTTRIIDATVKSAFEKGFKLIIPQGANSTFDNDYMTGERKDCISTTVTIDTYGKCEYKVIEKISEYDQSFRIREHIKKALTREAFEKVKNFTFYICRCANLYFLNTFVL